MECWGWASSVAPVLQDAVIGGHTDVQKLLHKHGGRAYKALAANATAIEAMAEGDRRHAITEILHFASTGDIKRMQVLCREHGIKVSTHAHLRESSHCSMPSTAASCDQSNRSIMHSRDPRLQPPASRRCICALAGVRPFVQ